MLPPEHPASRARCAALLGAVLCMLSLAGCAETPSAPGRIERANMPLPATTVDARLSLDDIVRLGREGLPAERLIERLRSTSTRHALNASQILELRLQGVDVRVLDELIEADRRQRWEDTAAELARRDQACGERLRNEQLQCRMQSMMTPWSAPPFGCLPPRPGFPFWQCF
jgi:hypothetical protein